jgi:hypothetical protein
MSKLYSLLNKDTKDWWYHAELRRLGQAQEARRLERQSIRSSVKSIRQALTAKTSLTIYEHGWVLDLGPNATLSGHYVKRPFLEACKYCGIPIVNKQSR